MPRKRFNAFEDFPVEPPSESEPQPQTGQKEERKTPQQPASLFSRPSGAAEKHSPAYGAGMPVPAQAIERIERLKPSQMVPDRFQPRRLLPTELRQPYYSGQIDCYQAAEGWLRLAREDEGIQEQVERLLKMGLSFEEHGQIKPITGSWVEQPQGGFIFQIETGERRFWAACLQAVAHKFSEEPLLRVEAITQPTRIRQVLENRHAEPPSAVGQACEVAALILHEIGIPPSPDEQNEYKYFRRARAQRMPPGLWDNITPIMDVSRIRLVQLLDILALPDTLLDLADRYRVSERVLRVILKQAPREQWESLLNASIHKKLTADQVAELAQRPTPEPKTERRPPSPPDPIQQALNAFTRYENALHNLDPDTQNDVLEALATELVIDDRGEQAIEQLSALIEKIRIRLQNRQRRHKA
jgi:hypothetical protein